MNLFRIADLQERLVELPQVRLFVHLVDAIPKREHLVKLTLRNRVVLVVMAASTTNGQP